MYNRYSYTMTTPRTTNRDTHRHTHICKARDMYMHTYNNIYIHTDMYIHE